MTVLCICNVSEHWSIASGLVCLPSPNLIITGVLAMFANQVTMVTVPLGDCFRGKRCRNRTKASREWGWSIFVLFLESYLHLLLSLLENIKNSKQYLLVSSFWTVKQSWSKLYVLFHRLYSVSKCLKMWVCVSVRTSLHCFQHIALTHQQTVFHFGILLID